MFKIDSDTPEWHVKNFLFQIVDLFTYSTSQNFATCLARADMQMGLQHMASQRVLVGMGPVSLPAYRALALSAAALPMGVHSSTAAVVAACRRAQAGPFRPAKARFS